MAAASWASPQSHRGLKYRSLQWTWHCSLSTAFVGASRASLVLRRPWTFATQMRCHVAKWSSISRIKWRNFYDCSRWRSVCTALSSLFEVLSVKVTDSGERMCAYDCSSPTHQNNAMFPIYGALTRTARVVSSTHLTHVMIWLVATLRMCPPAVKVYKDVLEILRDSL